jgi:hypothetical protein
VAPPAQGPVRGRVGAARDELSTRRWGPRAREAVHRRPGRLEPGGRLLLPDGVPGRRTTAVGPSGSAASEPRSPVDAAASTALAFEYASTAASTDPLEDDETIVALRPATCNDPLGNTSCVTLQGNLAQVTCLSATRLGSTTRLEGIPRRGPAPFSGLGSDG